MTESHPEGQKKEGQHDEDADEPALAHEPLSQSGERAHAHRQPEHDGQIGGDIEDMDVADVVHEVECDRDQIGQTCQRQQRPTAAGE